MTVPPKPRRQWTDAEIEQEVRRIVAEQAGVPVDQVTPVSQLIEDMEFDSLDITETVMSVEDVFDLRITDEELDAQVPKSVADLIAIIKQRLQNDDGDGEG